MFPSISLVAQSLRAAIPPRRPPQSRVPAVRHVMAPTPRRITIAAVLILGAGSPFGPWPVPCAASVVHVKLGWESGTVDSGLAEPLKPSFSINGDGWTPPKNPGGSFCQSDPSDSDCWPESAGLSHVDGGRDIHSLSVHNVSWAREGSHVLKVYADGRNYGGSGTYAYRAELSAVQDEYVFLPGDYQLYAMSFWLDSSYDQVSKYSGLLMQWKMSPGYPHGALRISNLGDYRLYFRGYHLWEDNGDGKYIGQARREAWNDIKFFYKKSMGADGLARVWLNGELVFDHAGPTLLKTTQRGYTKFGQYTEIRDERTVYYDAVEFCHGQDYTECLAAMGVASLAEWTRQGQQQPAVSITRVNGAQAPRAASDAVRVPRGENLTLVAEALDPEGRKYRSRGGVAKVEFFAGNCSLGAVAATGTAAANGTVANYSLSTAALAAAELSHEITAVVTDADGNAVKSEPPLLLHVGNTAPAVELVEPNALHNVAQGGDLVLRANASDADGAVSRVDFFADGALVGSAAAAGADGLHSATWAALAVGAYAVSAVATDAEGRNATSSTVGVTVGATLTTSTLIAADDVTLRQGSPDSVCNWADNEVYGKPGAQNVALVRFDVADLAASGHQVRSATLQLYVVGGRNLPGRFALYGVNDTAAWAEASTTWRNAPERAAKVSSVDIAATGAWVHVDVAEHVAAALGRSPPATSLSFWVEDERQDYSKFTFESRRPSNDRRPALVVSTSDVAAPATLAPPEGPRHACGGNSTAVDIGATATSKDPSVFDPAAEDTAAPTEVPTAAPTAAPAAGAPVPGICNASSSTALPVADASIRQSSPSSTGNWGNIEVYGKPGGNAIVALLKFDVGGIPPAVQKAELKLYAVVSRNSPGPVSVFRAESEDWEEDTVTWNSAPGRGALVANFTVHELSEEYPGDGEPAGYYIVDVTTAVAERAESHAQGQGPATLSLWLEATELDYLALKFESRRDDKDFPPLLTVLAANQTCDLVVAGHFEVSVPAAAAFLADADAKAAACDGIAFEGGASLAQGTDVVCRFALAEGPSAPAPEGPGDLFANYSFTVPAAAGAGAQSLVVDRSSTMTAAEVESAVAEHMAQAKGAQAADFQVIVNGMSPATTGGPALTEEPDPTASPTSAPTSGPTAAPTPGPTAAPTQAPDGAPAAQPTPAPVASGTPTVAESGPPTEAPQPDDGTSAAATSRTARGRVLGVWHAAAAVVAAFLPFMYL